LIEETDVQNFAGSIELPDARATLDSPTPTWTMDGQRILVERLVDARPWPWLDNHRADFGVIALVVGLAIASWWTVRTVRRPRAAGRTYCRRCNQELDISVRLPERCPECGSQLGQKQRVIGRRLAWRLLPLPLAAIAIALAGALAIRGTLLWSTLAPFRPFEAWPNAFFVRFASWPLWRVPRQFAYAALATRVDIIDCPPSNELRHLSHCVIQKPAAGEWVASDDGGILAWAVFDPTSGWNQEIRWFDTVAQQSHTKVIGSNADGFVRVCGFTPDGRSIVARRDRLVGPATSAATAPYPVEIVVVDMSNGAVRVVAESEAIAIGQPGPGANWQLEAGTAAVGAGPRIEWATVTLGPPPMPTPAKRALLTHLMVGTAGEVRQIELKGDALVPIGGIRRARIVDDRRLAFEGPSARWAGEVVGVEIDLETGAVSISRALGEIVSEDGAIVSSKVASPDGRRAVDIKTATTTRTTQLGSQELESVWLQLWTQ